MRRLTWAFVVVTVVALAPSAGAADEEAMPFETTDGTVGFEGSVPVQDDAATDTQVFQTGSLLSASVSSNRATFSGLFTFEIAIQEPGCSFTVETAMTVEGSADLGASGNGSGPVDVAFEHSETDRTGDCAGGVTQTQGTSGTAFARFGEDGTFTVDMPLTFLFEVSGVPQNIVDLFTFTQPGDAVSEPIPSSTIDSVDLTLDDLPVGLMERPAHFLEESLAEKMGNRVVKHELRFFEDTSTGQISGFGLIVQEDRFFNQDTGLECVSLWVLDIAINGTRSGPNVSATWHADERLVPVQPCGSELSFFIDPDSGAFNASTSGGVLTAKTVAEFEVQFDSVVGDSTVGSTAAGPSDTPTTTGPGTTVAGGGPTDTAAEDSGGGGAPIVPIGIGVGVVLGGIGLALKLRDRDSGSPKPTNQDEQQVHAFTSHAIVDGEPIYTGSDLRLEHEDSQEDSGVQTLPEPGDAVKEPIDFVAVPPYEFPGDENQEPFFPATSLAESPGVDARETQRPPLEGPGQIPELAPSQGEEEGRVEPTEVLLGAEGGDVDGWRPSDELSSDVIPTVGNSQVGEPPVGPLPPIEGEDPDDTYSDSEADSDTRTTRSSQSDMDDESTSTIAPPPLETQAPDITEVGGFPPVDRPPTADITEVGGFPPVEDVPSEAREEHSSPKPPSVPPDEQFPAEIILGGHTRPFRGTPAPANPLADRPARTFVEAAGGDPASDPFAWTREGPFVGALLAAPDDPFFEPRLVLTSPRELMPFDEIVAAARRLALDSFAHDTLSREDAPDTAEPSPRLRNGPPAFAVITGPIPAERMADQNSPFELRENPFVFDPDDDRIPVFEFPIGEQGEPALLGVSPQIQLTDAEAIVRAAIVAEGSQEQSRANASLGELIEEAERAEDDTTLEAIADLIHEWGGETTNTRLFDVATVTRDKVTALRDPVGTAVRERYLQLADEIEGDELFGERVPQGLKTGIAMIRVARVAELLQQLVMLNALRPGTGMVEPGSFLGLPFAETLDHLADAGADRAEALDSLGIDDWIGTLVTTTPDDRRLAAIDTRIRGLLATPGVDPERPEFQAVRQHIGEALFAQSVDVARRFDAWQGTVTANQGNVARIFDMFSTAFGSDEVASPMSGPRARAAVADLPTPPMPEAGGDPAFDEEFLRISFLEAASAHPLLLVPVGSEGKALWRYLVDLDGTTADDDTFAEMTQAAIDAAVETMLDRTRNEISRLMTMDEVTDLVTEFGSPLYAGVVGRMGSIPGFDDQTPVTAWSAMRGFRSRIQTEDEYWSDLLKPVVRTGGIVLLVVGVASLLSGPQGFAIIGPVLQGLGYVDIAVTATDAARAHEAAADAHAAAGVSGVELRHLRGIDELANATVRDLVLAVGLEAGGVALGHYLGAAIEARRLRGAVEAAEAEARAINEAVAAARTGARELAEAPRAGGAVSRVAGAVDDPAMVLARLDDTHGPEFLLDRADKLTPPDAGFFARTGLVPKVTVETRGYRFHLSEPFAGPGGKTAIVAFQETLDGTVIPRIWYSSGRRGVWRAVPNMTDDIAKGPIGFFDGGVPSTRSGAWDFKQYVNPNAVDLAPELQGIVGRWGSRSPLALADGDATRAFNGSVENQPFSAGVEYGRLVAPAQVLEPLVRGDAGIPVGALPDFTKGIRSTWQFNHPLYGDVSGFLVASSDGSTLYTVLKSGDDVWVPSVHYADASLTPFGTASSVPFLERDLVASPLTHAAGEASGYVVDPRYRNALADYVKEHLPSVTRNIGPFATVTPGFGVLDDVIDSAVDPLVFRLGEVDRFDVGLGLLRPTKAATKVATRSEATRDEDPQAAEPTDDFDWEPGGGSVPESGGLRVPGSTVDETPPGREAPPTTDVTSGWRPSDELSSDVIPTVPPPAVEDEVPARPSDITEVGGFPPLDPDATVPAEHHGASTGPVADEPTETLVGDEAESVEGWKPSDELSPRVPHWVDGVAGEGGSAGEHSRPDVTGDPLTDSEGPPPDPWADLDAEGRRLSNREVRETMGSAAHGRAINDVIERAFEMIALQAAAVAAANEALSSEPTPEAAAEAEWNNDALDGQAERFAANPAVQHERLFMDYSRILQEMIEAAKRGDVPVTREATAGAYRALSDALRMRQIAIEGTEGYEDEPTTGGGEVPSP